MATIRFYTRSKFNDRLAPVWIRLLDGRRTDLRTPTPFRIIPDYWNEQKQTLKQRILYTKVFTEDEAKDIEDKFVQLKDVILREHYKPTAPAIKTKEWLKTIIDKFYYKEPVSNENLTEYINRFVDEAKSGKRLASVGNTKKKYSYGSIRVLTGFKQSFELFCNAKEKRYNFNDINIDFYNDFLKFFYDRNCGANYIGKHIKSLKTIIRQARDRTQGI